MQAEHLPRAAVVVARPAGIEDVAEAEETIGRSRGRKSLPRFQLIAGTAKHDDAVDALVHRKTCSRRRSVRGAGNDHFSPIQARTVGGDKLLPLSLRMRFREMFHELKRPLPHAVRFWNDAERRKIFAGGGLEPQFAEARAVVAGLGRNDSKPFVGVADLDRVQPVIAETVEERGVVVHEPNDEAATRCGASIDHGVFDILRFARLVLENEINLRVRARPCVELTRPRSEVVALRLRISVSWGGGLGGAGDRASEEKPTNETAHGCRNCENLEVTWALPALHRRRLLSGDGPVQTVAALAGRRFLILVNSLKAVANCTRCRLKPAAETTLRPRLHECLVSNSKISLSVMS